MDFKGLLRQAHLEVLCRRIASHVMHNAACRRTTGGRTNLQLVGLDQMRNRGRLKTAFNR
eukprot:6196680-Pleurochrysis_carterae.AAC.1